MNDKKYEIFRSLFHKLEAYAPADGEASLRDFIFWMADQLTAGEEAAEDMNASDLIGYHLLMNARYASTYIKKAIQDSPLSSPDDIGFLLALYPSQVKTKGEVIRENAHEKTTGTEILRRLHSRGLLNEADDPGDGRKKRISLSPAGLDLVHALFPALGQAGKLAIGQLSRREAIQLLHLLEKLSRFHQHIYLEHRDKSLGELSDAFGIAAEGRS
jgi:DNA-binding MarR family transcriptional regulator